MQHRKGVGVKVVAGLLGGLTGVLTGCSSQGTVLEDTKGGVNEHAAGGARGSSDSFSSGVAGGVNGGAPGDLLMLGAGGAVASSDGGICDGVTLKPEQIVLDPVDLYLMVDQSLSMSDAQPAPGTGTWWTALQGALAAFVSNPSFAGTNVGIQYFPLGGVAPASCNADYATPDVELGPLPGNADALARSIGSHTPPSGFTPTAPALQGALDHMKSWASKHPGRTPAVVLVTDGFPTECDPQQIQDVAAIARAAFDVSPGVRTFVVGINLGSAGANLDQIASAGGTGKAVLIDSGSVQAQFVTAMNAIAASTGSVPLSCSIRIPAPPDGKTIDYTKIALRLDKGDQTLVLHKFANVDACNAGDGWYYDNAAAPTTIELCPSTCTTAQAGWTLQLVIGCPSP